MKLNEDFFTRDPKEVAKDLLGRELVRQVDDIIYRGTITEMGAYQGRGKRTSGQGISYAPGRIYIMPHRGNYFFNIATEEEGKESCVWIRELLLEDAFYGPGEFTKRLGIDRNLDGSSIEGDELWIQGEQADPSSIVYVSPQQEKMAPNCLGYYWLRM